MKLNSNNSVEADRKNLMTISSISLFFLTFAYVLTFLALSLFHCVAPYLYCVAIPWQLQPAVFPL